MGVNYVQHMICVDNKSLERSDQPDEIFNPIEPGTKTVTTEDSKLYNFEIKDSSHAYLDHLCDVVWFIFKKITKIDIFDQAFRIKVMTN